MNGMTINGRTVRHHAHPSCTPHAPVHAHHASTTTTSASCCRSSSHQLKVAASAKLCRDTDHVMKAWLHVSQYARCHSTVMVLHPCSQLSSQHVAALHAPRVQQHS